MMADFMNMGVSEMTLYCVFHNFCYMLNVILPFFLGGGGGAALS